MKNRRPQLMAVTLAGLMAILLGGSSLAASWNAESQALEALEQLRRSYAAIDSVHLKATAIVWLRGPEPDHQNETVSTASYEYWADGPRYRIINTAGASLGLAADVDIAFNGSLFQLHNTVDDVLSFQQSQPEVLPVPFPNPLFLPIDFLGHNADLPEGGAIDLSKASRQGIWAKLTPLQVEATQEDELMIQLPGGVHLGTPFTVKVYLAKQAGALVPVRIDRHIVDNDQLMGRIRLEDYQVQQTAKGPVRLPRTIALSAADYEGDGTQEMYTKITIEELTLNPTEESLGADRFSPDLNRAAIVWDSDSRHFLKHREPRMVGPEASLPLPPEQP